MFFMVEIFGMWQVEFNKVIGDWFDGMLYWLGNFMIEQSKVMYENLCCFQECFVVIDIVQNNIQLFVKDVVGFQVIFFNKQMCGVFGQLCMEMIIVDGLFMGVYEFQVILLDGLWLDCFVWMLNGQFLLVVDVKFLLEVYNVICDVGLLDVVKFVVQNFCCDFEVYIVDIVCKYLIKGEMQDIVFMFVLFELIFVEIYENFEGVVQKVYKFCVVIVLLLLLMLLIQVIQLVLKDQWMCEQVYLIQGEVICLMEDMSWFDECVQKLQMYFVQMQKDVEFIVILMIKLMKCGVKIEEMEFEMFLSVQVVVEEWSLFCQVESCIGMLKFCVVDEEQGEM